MDDKSTPKITQMKVFQRVQKVKKRRKASGKETSDDFRGLLGREILRLQQDKDEMAQVLKRDEEIIELEKFRKERGLEESISQVDTEKEWVIGEIQRRMKSECNFLGSLRNFLKSDRVVNVGQATNKQNSLGNHPRRKNSTQIKAIRDSQGLESTSGKQSNQLRDIKGRKRNLKEIDGKLEQIQIDIREEVQNQKENILGPSEQDTNPNFENDSIFRDPETPNPEKQDRERNHRNLTIEIDLLPNKETPNPKSTGLGHVPRILNNHFGELGVTAQMLSARVNNRREILTFQEEPEPNEASRRELSNNIKRTGNPRNRLSITQKRDKAGHNVNWERLGGQQRNNRNIGKVSEQTRNNYFNENEKTKQDEIKNAPVNIEIREIREKREGSSPRAAGVSRSNERRPEIEIERPRIQFGKSNLSEDQESKSQKTNFKINTNSNMGDSRNIIKHDLKDIKTPKYNNGNANMTRKGLKINKMDFNSRKIMHVSKNSGLAEGRDSERETASLGTDMLEFKPKQERQMILQSGSSGNHKTSGSEGHIIGRRSSTQTSNQSMLKPKHISSKRDMVTEKEFADSSANNHLFPSKHLSGEDDSQFYFSKKQIGDASGISLEQNIMRVTHETNDSSLFFSKKRTSEANFFADINNSEVQNQIKMSQEMNSLRNANNGSQHFMNFPRSQAGTLLSNLSAGIGSFPYGSNRGGRSSQANIMLAPEFETDMMSTKEKKMTQVDRGLGQDASGLMAKQNRREIDMGWIMKDSGQKSSERNGEGSRLVEGSERGMQKASNRFLFGDGEEDELKEESLWSRQESVRKEEVPGFDGTPLSLPPPLQAGKCLLFISGFGVDSLLLIFLFGLKQIRGY